MKTGTESKLKFKQLKRRLQLRYWQVVGILETLWRVALTDAPAGDIGRLDDEEIAAAMEWEDDPSSLINALVETHWLDRDDEFRLVIHDWSEHAPNHLVGAFKKHGKLFADELIRQRSTRDTAKHDAKDVLGTMPKQPAIAPCPGTMPPNQAKPNLTKPNQPTKPEASCLAEVETGLVVAGELEHWGGPGAAAAQFALKLCQYARIPELIRECRDRLQTPNDVVEVCDEYRANRSKFNGPGAIAERLRSGCWPVNGVRPVQPATKQTAAKRTQAADVRRRELIKGGVPSARDWDDDTVLKYEPEGTK